MNIKFVLKETLSAMLADDVGAACPAGSVGLDLRDTDSRRSISKALIPKGLISVYGEEQFPEHVRFVVTDLPGAEAYEKYAGRTMFYLPRTLSADTVLFARGANVRATYFCKEEIEERAPCLAVTGIKTLILTFLSAADKAATSLADVSGEEDGAFRFASDAAAFFAEPPQKQNYLARLVQLIKEGEPFLQPPFSRFAALTRGAGEDGFAELLFLAAFLQRAVQLPFLDMLTLGSERAEILYFIAECREEVVERLFGEDGFFKIARHVRLLTGKYAFDDAELEACFATLNAAVRAEEGGFLSALKKEGVLQGFVKYPL